MILFGGKGGVGKTTCAAAAALSLAETGRRVLAVTTDPAPSLGDAFNVRLSGEPTEIHTKRGVLFAVELAAGPALARWQAEHREELREIAARGTYLDPQDVDRFLDLSMPGADELIAWIEIARLVRETASDEVVVDAAPTAHTLRLLAMPEALRGFARALDHLQDRHRWMAERFGGVWKPDASDAFVGGLESQAREIQESLRDPGRSAVYWVMLPEALSLEETVDALAALDGAGIPVREVIVNRVMLAEEEGCSLCRERRAAEAVVIGEIRKRLGGRPLRFLVEEEREPRGKTALRRMAKGLGPSPPAPLPTPPSLPHRERGERRQSHGAFAGAGLVPALTKEAAGLELGWLEALAPVGVQLVFFGGKGGVGKTTCSSAVALALAAWRPAARVLLISTDPAHSVADALEVPLGDDERAIPGGPQNLKARELDAGRAFADWRDRYRDTVGEATGTLTVESGGIQELLDLTPPGVDELLAISSLLDVVSGDYDLVIVDTAPTGHALRLLEMPELALSWDHYLLSLLLKYREAIGLGDLAKELVELSKSLKRLEALLRDPARARFVAVTRAAELPHCETVRLLRSLRELGIAVPTVIFNAVPLSGCARCGPSNIDRKGFEGCAIMKAPAEFPPPRGVARLQSWVRSWETITA